MSDAPPDPDPGEARARRVCAFALAWGVATLALLWLFARAFRS